MSNHYAYTVEGKGEFPVDMLRRDQSYPQNTNDALTILGEHMRKTHLISTSGYPNVERWKSFGWKVLAAERIS